METFNITKVSIVFLVSIDAHFLSKSGLFWLPDLGNIFEKMI